MGEGVTNPVRGAASSSPAAADPVSSLLLHVDSSIQLILLLTVVSAVAFRWIFRSRKGPSNDTTTAKDTERPHQTLGIIANDIDCSDQEIPGRFLADVDEESNLCSDRKDVLNSEITKCPSTGFCSKSEPRLRRSVGDRKTLFPLQSYKQSPDSLVPILLYNVARCATRRLPGFRMDPSDTPSVPDPQPDSFFTWDSGGSSGEYSFVHTAVELPKYPDGAITEEERQMLLLYMQTGHPELLLTPSQSGHQNGGAQMSENVLCDPVAVRGFLETIVEENSDDLRSPSECDETSLGWGSWDESDEDRLTVVEMVTSTTNDFASGDSVHVSVDDFLNNGVLSEQGKLRLSTGEGVYEEGRQSVDKDQLCENKEKGISSPLLSGVKSVNNLSRNVPTFENDSYMDNTISSTQKCEKNSENSRIHNKPSKMDFGSEPGVSSNLNNSLNSNGCFDSLWITQNTLDSPSETLNPWTTIDFKEHCEDNNDLTSLDISNPEQIIEGVNPLLVLGSDDICLVPSSFNSRIENENSENLMFSDNFKDYFLPAENYTPTFNKNVPDLLADFLSDDQPDSLTEKPLRCLRIGFGSTITEERSIPLLDASKESHDVNSLNEFINGSNCFSTEKSLNNPENSSLNEDTIRCLRIGFGDDSPSEEYLFPHAANIPYFNESESLNVFHMEGQSDIQNSNVQEAMFSPLDGDIVYGSTWANTRGLKEPEKTSSGTEVHCSAAQADVRCEPTMLTDSPPPDNNRPASDDDITEVPNSLSRWRHHTDLQHLQEGTSPITRWQHHSSLQFFPEGCKQTTDSEESDDGLPPQLKEIYSSFKMRDNKMGRIRIKEDKNNNFKRLGLWEKESKVTLPPFNTAQSTSAISSHVPIQKESNGVSKEDLDDLEFDMFAVNKNPVSQNNVKIAANGDSDIDDALRSFNHLDDYSSESEDNSDSENCYVVNFREKKENDISEILEVAEEDSIGSSIEDKQLPSSGEMLSLENPCSDNSDNCPLCTDPSFKNSHINDLFSLQNSDTLEKDVQSLLQKTYPKMVRLSQSNLSDAEVIESNGESNKTGDSISPITTSDSDEGVRVKEVKKRVKKRSKDNSSTELKHDDSGYVEDDEDEDDDSLGENSEKLSSASQLLSTDATNQTRKSLSTAFYESKSNKIEHADSNLPSYAIPETFQEFSKQLELSLSNEEIRAGFMNEDRWNIPENISQFSAWLLDKELKKISNRDEMEKLLVDDMMSLREQTIAKFLKNSLSSDEKVNLKSQDLPSHSDNFAPVENFPINTSNVENRPLNLEASHSDFAENMNDRNINLDSKETEAESLTLVNEDNFTKYAQDSENELPEEYYSYNFNTQVSKIFEENGNSTENKTDEISKEQPLSNLDYKNKLNNVSPTIIESDASFQKSVTAVDTYETKLQINNIEKEITHHSKPAISRCDEYNLEYNSSAYLCTEGSGVEPPENKTQQSDPLHPSITSVPPSASENTQEIQPKVNDTTIQKEEEKALPEVVNSPQVSPESIPVGNVNIDDSTKVKEVAASVGRNCNLSGVDTEGVDRDLMTQGVPPGEKGACVGPRADGISTPEAEVVSADLNGETHVHFNAYHAYSLDSRPSHNSDLHISGAQDIAPQLTAEKDFGNWSVISDSDIVSVSDKVNSGSEEVDCCLPVIVEPLPTQEEDSVKERKGFTTVDYADSPADSVVLKEDAASNDDKEVKLDRDISNGEVGGLCLSNDSELFICDKTLETHCIDLSDNQNWDLTEHFPTKEENSDLNNSKEILDLAAKDSDSKKPDLIPSDQISGEFETNIPVYRGDYQRSNSLGRDSGEADETFELWSGQSKSTPDLRRCHEQQKKCNAPLSVRLSKSVSQRIEDYLGRNSRDGRLSKSLPPNERSRHYRRICVSTETVVEKAARFEARSKSNCAVRELSEDRSSFSKRSGSCPPSSMRSNTSWISDRSYRNYNKPTATVRPTMDVHRNGTAYKKDLKDYNGGTQNEKENILELITGYTKATKVTHKPPVPPSTINLQQSLKSARLKGKIANARKDFFERLSQQDLSEVPKRDDTFEDDASTPDSSGLRRFDEFRRSAREERARLAASHPDLGALEAAVRSSKRKIDQLKKRNRTTTKSGSQSPPGPMPSGSKDLCLPYRRATGEIAWASCAKRVEEAAAKRSKGKLAHEQLEIVDGQRAFAEKTAELRAHPPSDHPADPAIADGGNCDFLGTRARSMDFLLDADNRERAQPPENRLGGPGGQTRVKSEHELRIERSLQNLTVPDWYKQSAWSKKPTEGFILRRGSEGSAGESRKRWQGLSSSRTPSTTSLNPPSYSSQRSIVVPKRVTPGGSDWRYTGSLVSSRESLTPASPASLSPRECASAAFQYGLGSSLSRWSSSRLSTSSAPLTALSVHRSFRQPYLGWRAAAASSSGGGSRSSPGTSPVNATTPVMQGSRPESPRRGSQEHHYAYGLQQNQITSAATLRPDSAEQPSDSNRISPLALNTTNIFFSSNVDDQLAQQHPQRFAGPELRRDRYSYTQSLYSGTVIVSPLEDSSDDRRNFNIYEEEDVPNSSKFRIVSSPQPPRVWMESSFVGSKKDGSNEPQVPPPRTIRIIPSDSAGVRTDRFGTVPGASAGSSAMRGGTCATQTAMDTRELIDHLHNFLRGLQNRNQMLRPSSTSAFTPVPSSSNSGFQQDDEDDGLQSAASLHINGDQRPNLVDYDSEPKAYPRVSWRRSSSSSKDVSPDNSSTDNELWLSVGEDMAGPHKGFRTTPERHMDGSSRSSVSPPSPPLRYPQPQKRVSEDSTGSQRPIFFASSRRGSKGSNPDTSRNESSGYLQNPVSPTAAAEVRPSSRDELSRKSSSAHSEEMGGIRRDSRSGGSNSWRDSRTDQESSSATTSRGEKDSKSSASMEEVLESLLAIPPTSSLSSSPTSPRRSKGPSYYQSHHRFAPRMSQEIHSTPPDVVLRQKSDQLNMMDPITRSTEMMSPGATFSLGQQGTDEGDEGIDDGDQQGKMFDGSFSFPQPYPSSNSSAKQLPISSPLGEVNLGSFCRSSSTSPLEDDVQSPTSMEVLVPEGEEQELSSIIEGRGPSTTTGDEQQQGGSATPIRKKKTSNMISTTEGHLKCHRPKCTKSLPVEEARAKFRTCPNCYTYYCSRQCRKLHLARHKDHCPQTRISNLCKQVLMKARDDPVSRRHLSLCAKRGLLSRGRGAVKLLFLNPEDALDYLVHGWESAKGQTLYVSRSDLLPQEMGSDVFSQVRSFCDKYNPDRKFILLAAITVTNEIAAALEREVVVRGAKMHLSPSLPEDDVQTLILTITKTDPETGDPKQTTVEERRCGLNVVEEQLSTRGVDLEKLYPHTYRKLLKYVAENEPFSPISIFPMDQRNGRVFMCIILPWADPDIIVNISSKVGAATGKSSKKKWIS